MALVRVFRAKLLGVLSHITAAIWKLAANSPSSVPVNRMDVNRLVPSIMGTFNWIPCTFQLQGRRMNRNVSKLRLTCFKTQIALSVLYALHINFTLVVNISHEMETVDHLLLGTHLTRAMFSLNFTYWSYQMFIVHFWDQAMLYEFAQSSQVLMQRPLDTSKESALQDWLLLISPFTIHCFSPLLCGLFLYSSSSNQFVFALLPATAQESIILKLLAAAYELNVATLWLTAGQYGFFHWIAFLRVVQRELVNNVASIE